MYEQDIQIAKLLFDRLTEIDQRAEALHTELDGTRNELQRIAEVRDERAQYLDILSRAARLLERADLEVESPQTDDLEAREADLLERIDEISREAQVYRELINELSSRAPQLVEAAGVQEQQPPAAADMTASTVPATFDAALGAEPLEAAAEEGEPDSHPFPESAGAELDQDAVLGRFNLSNLKAKESFTIGRGAAYLIDATSVLERVPHYDSYFRAMKESAARDELVRDIDMLSCELSGNFHIVFNAWHQPGCAYGNNVLVEYATGENEGTKPAGDRRIRELVSSMSGKEHSLCIVTGDSDLADELRSPGVHIISLGEFFRT